MGKAIRKLKPLHVGNNKLSPLCQARLGYRLRRPLNHVGTEVYPDYFSPRAYLVSRQNNVYPSPATQIYNHFTRLQISEPRRVATASGEAKSELWH